MRKRGTSSSLPFPAQLSGVQSQSKGLFSQGAVCPKTDTTPIVLETTAAGPPPFRSSPPASAILVSHVPSYPPLWSPQSSLNTGYASDSPRVRFRLFTPSPPLQGSPAPKLLLEPVLIGRWLHFCHFFGRTRKNFSRLLQSHSLMSLSIKSLAPIGVVEKVSSFFPPTVRKEASPKPPLVEKVKKGRPHPRHRLRK